MYDNDNVRYSVIYERTMIALTHLSRGFDRLSSVNDVKLNSAVKLLHTMLSETDRPENLPSPEEYDIQHIMAVEEMVEHLRRAFVIKGIL